MSNRMKSICKGYGCTDLLPSPGYCDKHKRTFDTRAPWNELDRKKTAAEIAFYSSGRWSKTSKSFRKNNPLCETCKENGKTTAVQLVHHDPDLKQLLAKGLDPCDWKYLHGSCNMCHLGELRKKKYKKKPIKKSLLERMGW